MAATKSPVIQTMNEVHNDAEINDGIDEGCTVSDDEEGGTRIGDIYIPPPVKPHCSTESKGPRLIITNIVIENFKSYAGKVELGPFHHCTSAVIGPNGSGKSNVIDSMLFVFGYRAQKLRSKKLSVLLHSSSTSRQCDHCSVYVYFKQVLDKPDGSFDDLPNSEFVIKRTAHKDNSSYYSVNDRKTNFKEVAKILRQHGIDLDHNRFLILQGEVESIAMMKPKAQTPTDSGFLEYLEDIVGTSRYKEPLIKINTTVERLNEERTEKHNRCKISEREMKDLEQPMQEAVDFLKSENELTRVKNLQFQKYLLELRKKLKEYEESHDAVKNELQEHDNHFDEIKQKRIEKENLNKEETQKHVKLQKQKEQMENMHQNAVTKLTELQTSLAATNKRRKQAGVQVEKEKEKLVSIKEIPEKNQKVIESSEASVEKLVKDKEKLEETLAENLSNLKNETAALTSEKEKFETELIDLQKIADDSKSELAVVESELKMYEYTHTNESRKLQSFKGSLVDTEETLTQKNEALNEKQTELNELKTNLSDNITKYQQMEKNEAELGIQLRKLTGEIEEYVNSMQKTKSQGKVLQSLMDEKQKGRIPGILGRLGDLGGIDLKYDVAISTCCGRLDNIVVDTANTAQSCIEHLKKYNIGRATFIALEKIHYLHNRCSSQIQTPENVHRLFDLVRVEDERVRPAFYFALQDTLVANDIDQATRIAYGRQRYRVVTLKGEVIEMSGTMSGGGKTQMRGRMGQSVALKTNITSNTSANTSIINERNQVKAQEIRESISYSQEQRSALDKDINILKSKIPRLENEVKKLIVEIRNYTTQIPRIQEQIKEQEIKVENCKTDPAKVKQLKSRIGEKQKIHSESEKNAKLISTKADDISKKIAEITGCKINEVKKKIKSKTQEIDKLNNCISKLRVEISISERDVKKTEDKIENLNSEITTAEQTIKSDCKLRTETENDITMLDEKVKKLKADLEELQSGFSEIKKEIAAIQKQENEGNIKRLEIEEKMKTIEKGVSDTKNQMPNWQKQLKPLKLHVIPNSEPEEPLKTFTDEELEKYKIQDLQYQFSVIEEALQSKKPNLSVIQEYETKRQIYLERVTILENITTKRNEMRKLYESVRNKRYTEFMQGFNIISKKLKEMYQTITLGGDAELELADSMDPFNEGITFNVRPPKKSWKQISNLSGGEKTLSSLALVFALHYYKPSPLYVMDEIDAALDFKNVSIVAHYIRQRARNAQFIVISLRSNMFELSDVLVGIYKIKDCSGSIAINNVPPQSPTKKVNRNTENSQVASDAFDAIRDEILSEPSMEVEVDSNIVNEENNQIQLDNDIEMAD